MNLPHVMRTNDISKAAGELARMAYGVNIAGGKKSYVKFTGNRQHELFLRGKFLKDGVKKRGR